MQNAQFAVKHGNAVLLEEASLTEASLFHVIREALILNNNTPFGTTKMKLLSSIGTHVIKILDAGHEKMHIIFL